MSLKTYTKVKKIEFAPLPNDFALENCPCDRQNKQFNSNCPLLNKLNIPEEYQPAYQELFHVFNEPQLVKLIVTDRILGKTTNKILEVLVRVALAIVNKEPILPYWIWLRRDWNDNVEKVMGEINKVIRLFCLKYWKNEGEFSEKDFDAIYRGTFYKEQQFIYHYSLYHYDGPRGALLGNAQEIIFDECLPPDPSKYLTKLEENMTEEEMYSEILGGGYRTDKEKSIKITFLGNPYDRFFYGFNSWRKDLEEWAINYQKNKPVEFTIKEVKILADGDELIYLRKFPEKRKLLSKFKSIDQQVWEKRFFVPKEEMNMIDKPKKYFPHYMIFNRLICAGIPNRVQRFFYTPEANEKIPPYLPAWWFTNEERYTCLQSNKLYKNPQQESYKIARDLNNKELAFADFEARNRILEFITRHKYPPQTVKKPFQELDLNENK